PPPTLTPFPYTTLFRSPLRICKQYSTEACDARRAASLAPPMIALRRRGGIKFARGKSPGRTASLTGVSSCTSNSFTSDVSRTPRSEEHTSELQSPYDLV